MPQLFSYPSYDEIAGWCGGRESGPAAHVVDDVRRCLGRYGRFFTWSALVPLALGVAAAIALGVQEAQLPDATYWTLYAGLVVFTFFGIAQWRTLLTLLAPRMALYYYCSAGVDRLRGSVELAGDVEYVRFILPALEGALTSSRHAALYAGTVGLRKVVARSHRDAAGELASCERGYYLKCDDPARRQLSNCLGGIIVNSYFGLWVTGRPEVGTSDPAAGEDQGAPERATLWGTVLKAAGDKAAEQFVLAVGVLLLALLPKLQ